MMATRYRCCAHCRPACRDAAEGHVVQCRRPNCPGRVPVADPETEG